jgi:transcriptional regulator with XRE-family HTH domain
MESFGERVLAIRTERGWTRRELARRSGLHEVHLSKVETGERKRLEADTIIALAQALQVSTDYLLGLTDDPRPPRRREKPASADGEKEAAA